MAGQRLVNYREYKPQFFKDGLHPGCLIESGSLAAVASPDFGYVDLEVINKLPAISGAQKDAVFLAVQQYSIPSEIRRGFLLGDGPGVGKTRVIAGILKYYFEFSEPQDSKALWVTVSNDLSRQVQQEMKNVKLDNVDLLNALNLPIEERTGRKIVLLITYNALSYKRKNDKPSTFSNVKEFLGADFSGMVILDECQRAKNLRESEKFSTSTGLIIHQLQKTYPNAKVLYSSATSISDPSHFLYMERLCLWGTNNVHKTFAAFNKILSNRGVVGMEAFIQHLKLNGQMIARKLSCKHVTCRVEKIEVSDKLKEAYNKSTELWKESFQLLEEAIKPHKTIAFARFWSAQQRFFRNLCLAIKVERATEIAKQGLAHGLSIIFGIQSTGETASKNSLKYCIPPSSVCKYILHSTIVEIILPIAKSPRKVEELLRKVDRCWMPNNFLDDLVQQMGGSRKVAEMTGRFSANKSSRSGRSPNSIAREKFQNGELRIAIISDVTSTGFSLHDDVINPVSRKRLHITLELPWSAEKTIQQLGRSNRANQYTAPEYVILTSSVCGETRFAANVVHKLQNLGALTHGSRNFMQNFELVEFEFDYESTTNAVATLCEALTASDFILFKSEEEKFEVRNALHGVGFDPSSQGRHKLFERLMNRLLGIPLDCQQLVFDGFLRAMRKTQAVPTELFRTLGVVSVSQVETFPRLKSMKKVKFLDDVSMKEIKLDDYGNESAKLYHGSKFGPAVVLDQGSTKILIRPVDGKLRPRISIEELLSIKLDLFDGNTEDFQRLWKHKYLSCCSHSHNHGTENYSTFLAWRDRFCRLSSFCALTGDIWRHWEYLTTIVGQEKPQFVFFETEDGRSYFGVLVDENLLKFIG